MNPVQVQQLMEIARRLDAAVHGERAAIYEAGALAMGVSLSTLQRQLKLVCVAKPRKRRCDAGSSALPIEEARLISAMLLESIRANDKQLSTIDRAVERLRSNHLITAGRVDEATGVFRPLSRSAICRALVAYKLHPSQLLQDAPAVSLASQHPNHVWQVDASISTQFYLADDGARVMGKAEFYDGKPANLKRIERQRLWRYVVTDHTSGTLYVEYVLGAESAENLCGVLINAMQKRGESDPFHGVPLMLMSRKVLEQLATGTSCEADALAARKAKAVPFDGRIDPHKYVNDTVLPAYLPRRGSNLLVNAPSVELAPLSLVEAAKLLRPRLGHLWSPKTYGWLMERFPDGVPQEQLEAIEAELKRPVEVGRRPVVSVGGV